MDVSLVGRRVGWIDDYWAERMVESGFGLRAG